MQYNTFCLKIEKVNNFIVIILIFIKAVRIQAITRTACRSRLLSLGGIMLNIAAL